MKIRKLSIRKRGTAAAPPLEPVAGNGLLDRRALLGRGIVFAGAMTTGAGTSSPAPPPSRSRTIRGAWKWARSCRPIRCRRASRRTWSARAAIPTTNSAIRTRAPRTICCRARSRPTACSSRSRHSGLPDIDPAQHKLVIHGLVKQPLVYTVESLSRYPMVTRMHFVECSGNSAPMFSNEPVQANAQALHGLVSNAEWTGVLLSTLLEETGIDPKAKWLLAEGADSLALHRSVPVKKALDDAMIALYQNGERIQPGNGYPMRLLLPGYQGNMNVKHVRRIKLIDQPAMSFYEAKTYSQILPDGKMWLFHFTQEVKSFITHPSFGHALKGPGYYEISGVAYSGNGRISKVDGLGRRRQELGAGGAAGAGAARRRSPASACRGAGTASRWCCRAAPGTRRAPCSRCAPSSWPRAVRPTRPVTNPLAFPNQHYNSLTSWGVDSNGGIKHVYA